MVNTNILSNKIKMLYDPSLSVEDNAVRCEVSVPTLNLWLRMNKVDRLYDSMYIRYKEIKKIKMIHLRLIFLLRASTMTNKKY